MVKRVTESFALHAQVGLVVRVWQMFDWDLRADRQPVALHPADLLRVVGENANRAEPEIDEDLRADAVVAQVGGKPQAQVRLDRVKAFLLEPVRAQLVQ